MPTRPIYTPCRVVPRRGVPRRRSAMRGHGLDRLRPFCAAPAGPCCGLELRARRRRDAGAARAERRRQVDAAACAGRAAAGRPGPCSSTAHRLGDADAWAERVAYAGHLDAVKPQLTVAENLAFWAALFGGRPRRRAALAAFGLAPLADRPAHALLGRAEAPARARPAAARAAAAVAARRADGVARRRGRGALLDAVRAPLRRRRHGGDRDPRRARACGSASSRWSRCGAAAAPRDPFLAGAWA